MYTEVFDKSSLVSYQAPNIFSNVDFSPYLKISREFNSGPGLRSERALKKCVFERALAKICRIIRMCDGPWERGGLATLNTAIAWMSCHVILWS